MLFVADARRSERHRQPAGCTCHSHHDVDWGTRDIAGKAYEHVSLGHVTDINDVLWIESLHCFECVKETVDILLIALYQKWL